MGYEADEPPPRTTWRCAATAGLLAAPALGMLVLMAADHPGILPLVAAGYGRPGLLCAGLYGGFVLVMAVSAAAVPTGAAGDGSAERQTLAARSALLGSLVATAVYGLALLWPAAMFTDGADGSGTLANWGTEIDRWLTTATFRFSGDEHDFTIDMGRVAAVTLLLVLPLFVFVIADVRRVVGGDPIRWARARAQLACLVASLVLVPMGDIGFRWGAPLFVVVVAVVAASTFLSASSGRQRVSGAVAAAGLAIVSLVLVVQYDEGVRREGIPTYYEYLPEPFHTNGQLRDALHSTNEVAVGGIVVLSLAVLAGGGVALTSRHRARRSFDRSPSPGSDAR